MCFWSVSEAFLAWGQLSEVTAAPLALSSLYSLHTHLALSSPLTLHLYALSLRRLTLSQLLPSRAGARMLACVLSLSRSGSLRPLSFSLSVNHSLLCHKDNSFWPFHMCVCVGVAFFRVVLKMSQSLLFYFMYTRLFGSQFALFIVVLRYLQRL